MTTAKAALVAHAGRFGAYPYGEVDVVLDNNFWFGGMEYPGFVLDLVSSTALAHELGHQWFYGIVGDDEYTTPWLDEALHRLRHRPVPGHHRHQLLEQRHLAVVGREDHQLDGLLGRPLQPLRHGRLHATASARCTTCAA